MEALTNDHAYRRHILAMVQEAFPAHITKVDCYGYLRPDFIQVLEVEVLVMPFPVRGQKPKKVVQYKKTIVNPDQTKALLAEKIITALKLMGGGDGDA